MPSPEPPRVLHVLRSLGRGGVETWLLHVLRNTPAGAWSSDFLLHSREPGAYDDEFRAHGATLRYCTSTRHPLRYMHTLRRMLHDCGPYDVVHSHVHLYSGVVLRAAHAAGVPVRVAHAHTAIEDRTRARRGYAALMRRWISRYATDGLACSPPAAATLFGTEWQRDPHIRIHECGLDYARFAQLPPRAVLKQQLGIAAERLVVGHVGRFSAPKNHTFLIATFAELIRSGIDAQLLLVGSGPLMDRARQQIEHLGIAERCSLAGAHNDVARFFGAMDIVVFPSLHEGTPLVVLEAQAAAVPVLASHAVPAEASVVRELMHFCPLANGPAGWAAVAAHILSRPLTLDRAGTAAALASSRYGIARSVRDLADLYRAQLDDAAFRKATGLRGEALV